MRAYMFTKLRIRQRTKQHKYMSINKDNSLSMRWVLNQHGNMMVPSSIFNDIRGLKMGGINESKKKEKNKNEACIQKLDLTQSKQINA